jgi:hypothetical protein
MNSLLSNAQLFELDPALVDTGNRIGFLHEDKARALGRLMAVDGQRDPIKVVAQPKNAAQPWRLVTGMHRTVGATMEGITVWAIEVSGKPEDLTDLEASENQHRRPLGPIEKAKFIAALVKAAQERLARQHGNLKHQQLGAKARWDRVKAGQLRSDQAIDEEASDAEDKMSAVYGWQESAALAFGLEKRSIRRALSLYRLVIEPFPQLAEPLSRHPVVGENAKQLHDIADVRDEGLRRKVIEMLLADPELSTDEARVRVGIDAPDGRAPSQEEKALSAVVGNLGRLSAAQQKQHLPMLVSGLKTAEVKRQLRDLLNKELGEQAAGPATGALKTAFEVITSLIDGEPVDDDELADAAGAVQSALFGLEPKGGR